MAFAPDFVFGSLQSNHKRAHEYELEDKRNGHQYQAFVGQSEIEINLHMIIEAAALLELPACMLFQA